MTVSHYQCWMSVAVGNACMLDPLEGMDRSYELLKGIPRVAGFRARRFFG